MRKIQSFELVFITFDPPTPQIYCLSAVPVTTEIFPLNLNLPHSFNFMREGYLRSLSLLPIFGTEIQVKQVLTSIIFKFSRRAHVSGGRQYFAEFLSKAKNIFVDIRFQELAWLNFLLDFSSLRNSKLEEQKRNFILNLK
jgi:hypothetical protein